MDYKRLARRLVQVVGRPFLVGLVGGLAGILPDGDHPLYWAWPTVFALFGAGGRSLHIPLALAGLYSWWAGIACYAGLGIESLLKPGWFEKVIGGMAWAVMFAWVLFVSAALGGIVALVWSFWWLIGAFVGV